MAQEGRARLLRPSLGKIIQSQREWIDRAKQFAAKRRAHILAQQQTRRLIAQISNLPALKLSYPKPGKSLEPQPKREDAGSPLGVQMEDNSSASRHIQSYREHATHLRARAVSGQWNEISEYLLELARQYDLLANTLERKTELTLKPNSTFK
jgi:hypothetical protein